MRACAGGRSRGGRVDGLRSLRRVVLSLALAAVLVTSSACGETPRRATGLHLSMSSRLVLPVDAPPLEAAVRLELAHDPEDRRQVTIDIEEAAGLRARPNLGELDGLPLRSSDDGELTVRRISSCRGPGSCASSDRTLVLDMSAATAGTYRLDVPITWSGPDRNGQAVLELRFRLTPSSASARPGPPTAPA